MLSTSAHFLQSALGFRAAGIGLWPQSNPERVGPATRFLSQVSASQRFFFSCLHCTATCGSNILVSAIIRNSLYHSPYWTFSKGKTNSNLKNSGQTLHLPGSQPQGNREARGSIRHPLVAEMYMRLAPWEGFSRLLLWFTAHYQFSLSMYPCVFLY